MKNLQNKTIPLYGVVSLPEMDTAALEVLHSGRIANGDFVPKFEAGFGKLIGQPHVVSMVDMTSAIFLALHLAGVDKDDEVLTTAFACLSTNAAISQCGAIPVWVDVKPQSVEIDLDDLVSKLTDKTKAVILYHVAGYPGPAQELAQLCKLRGITLIEDCNNALLATRDSLPVGTHGDYAIYSFYPTRQINTTEGAALVCKDAESADRARRLRRFGIDTHSFRKANGEINPASRISEIGWSFTMNNFCAALGLAQITTVSQRIDITRKNAAKLISYVSEINGVKPICAPTNSLPAYWVLLLLVENRDAVLTRMRTMGVMTSSIHYRNDHYAGFCAEMQHSLTNTKFIQDNILAIPCGWWLQREELLIVAEALQNAAITTAPIALYRSLL